MNFDPEKFSFGQMTSNDNGKTSGTGTMGILITTVGSIGFIFGCIDKMWLSKTTDILSQSIFLVGIGAGLLGYRKSQAGINNTQDIEVKDVTTVVTDDTKPLNS